MTSDRVNTFNLSVFRRALVVFPFTIIPSLVLGLLLGVAFGAEAGSNWLIDSIKFGGALGLGVGGALYTVVVVLRLLTNRCGIVLQEIVFMTVGAGIGWAIGGGLDVLRPSAGAFFGLIPGALLGALLKVVTDSKSEPKPE